MFDSQILQRAIVVTSWIGLIETNLLSCASAQNLFGGGTLNIVLIIIIIFAVVVIVVLACVLLYLWWKRQLAEGETVKAGFQNVQKNRQKESGVDKPEEKQSMEDDETPGNMETPGNEEQEIYMAQLAAERDQQSQAQHSSRMNENEHLNKKAEMFGGQLKDKQMGQKMVESDIVHQMHDDKTNKTPGHTPGYTPGDNNFVR